MRFLIALGFLSLVMSPASVHADEPQDVMSDNCPDCTPPTKDVCFNLVCNYELDRDSGFKKCSVASTFVKAVTKDGGEVVDSSNYKNNPTFEVSCDGKVVFNNSARRFTDLLGTRIQGESGPTPAIQLPRGELHTAASGVGGGHYSKSVLEIAGYDGFARGKGSCFIWTGYP